MWHLENLTTVGSEMRAVSRHLRIDKLINAYGFVKGRDIEKKQQKERGKKGKRHISRGLVC